LDVIRNCHELTIVDFVTVSKWIQCIYRPAGVKL
jgi:hypothetical protein